MTKIKSLLKISLPILIPLFFIVFLAGGGSFKLIDPQYYEFRKLCTMHSGKTLIGDKPSKQFIAYNNVIYKNLGSRVREMSFQEIINNEITFYENYTYFYDNYGIFLSGDEGRGFYFSHKELLDCVDLGLQSKEILYFNERTDNNE